MIRYRKQESTYFAWLDCRGLGLSDEDLKKRIHKLGVLPNMGFCFGEEGKGFIRLNLGCPKSVLEEKMNRLSKYSSAGLIVFLARQEKVSPLLKSLIFAQGPSEKAYDPDETGCGFCVEPLSFLAKRLSYRAPV